MHALVLALALSTTSWPCVRAAAVREATVLVVGDWGWGDARQRRVAAGMARVARGAVPPLSAIVSTGDQFYPGGVKNAASPLFDRLFHDVYSRQHPVPKIINFFLFVSFFSYLFANSSLLFFFISFVIDRPRCWSKCRGTRRWATMIAWGT